MKYGLMIQDLTEQEVCKVLEKLKDNSLPMGLKMSEAGPVEFSECGVTVDQSPNVVVNVAPLTPPVQDSTPAPTAAQAISDAKPAPTAGKVAPKEIKGEGVDSTGLPWDERIHAGSKGKKADGSWKRKRGVQDVEFDAVVEELKASQLAAPTAPQPSATFAPPPGTPPAATQPQAPVPPVAPAAPPIPAAINPPIARDFQGLMQQVSNLFGNKEIGPEYPESIVGRINKDFGAEIVSINDIADNQQMVEYAWQCLDVDGKGV